MGRPKKSEPTEPMRIPASFVKRIRKVALHRDQDPGDYLAQRFGPLLLKDEQKMLEEMTREQGGLSDRE